MLAAALISATSVAGVPEELVPDAMTTLGCDSVFAVAVCDSNPTTGNVPAVESPVIESCVTLPPSAVEFPAIVMDELLRVAFATALSVSTPEDDRLAVAPDPLNV